MFEEHFKRKRKNLYNQARGFLKDHHYAEDAVQEAYCLGLKYFSSFQETGNFDVWMQTVFSNVLKKMQKDIQNKGVTMEVDPHKFPVVVYDMSPESRVMLVDTIKASGFLEEEQKALILWLQYGYTSDEVVVTTGITKFRLYHLWKKLKNEVNEKEI